MSPDVPSQPPSASSSALTGHIGHLTKEQETAFEKFKSILEEKNLLAHTTNDHETSAISTYDDATLLRFLRARRFDPGKAEKQFSTTVTWRKENDVDNLYTTFDPVEFENSRKFYPRWTGRRDMQGLPVYVYRIGSLTEPFQQELQATPSKRRYQRIIALYEAMTRFVLPLCSVLPHPDSPNPISSVTTIIDLEDCSLRQMWALRNHLQEASELATANYPETLNTIAVVNSPSFFPTVWGWIKGWFDEGTRNKIHVLGRDPGKTLRTFIDAQNLPKVYGGELDWKYGDEPILCEDTAKAIGEMPKGPVLFVDGAIRRPSEETNGSNPSSEATS